MHVCILNHLIEFAGSHLSRLVHHISKKRARLLQKPMWPVKLPHLTLTHHLEHGERERERGEDGGREEEGKYRAAEKSSGKCVCGACQRADP